MKKKKKYQATEQYLTGRDQELKKKLEFSKTQGTIFRKVLASFEWQTRWTQYIIRCFERSAIQLPIKKSSYEATGEAREWASLSDLKMIKQLNTQEWMKDFCQSITEGMHINKSNIPWESVIINLEDGFVSWHEMAFMIGDSFIEMAFLSSDSLMGKLECFNHSPEDKIKGTVYIGEDHGYPKAVLKATGDDGSDYFFELSHFSMLFLLDRHNELFGEDADDEAVKPAPEENSEESNKKEKDADDKAGKPAPEENSDENNKKEKDENPTEDLWPDTDSEDGEVGMFMLFNMKYNVKFVTAY